MTIWFFPLISFDKNTYFFDITISTEVGGARCRGRGRGATHATAGAEGSGLSAATTQEE